MKLSECRKPKNLYGCCKRMRVFGAAFYAKKVRFLAECIMNFSLATCYIMHCRISKWAFLFTACPDGETRKTLHKARVINERGTIKKKGDAIKMKGRIDKSLNSIDEIYNIIGGIEITYKIIAPTYTNVRQMSTICQTNYRCHL